MVGPHWPKDKQMPIKGLDWKYREGTGPILNLLKDNGYFNEMAGSWYSIRSFGKRLFPKGFFTILWVPTYEYGPTDKNDSSVVIDGVKVPEFMQDFLTGHNVSKYTDYPSTVYDWMIQNYQDDLNIDRDLAVKLVYKDYKDHKGHLGEENQRKVLMNYILSNNELTSALEGN